MQNTVVNGLGGPQRFPALGDKVMIYETFRPFVGSHHPTNSEISRLNLQASLDQQGCIFGAEIHIQPVPGTCQC